MCHISADCKFQFFNLGVHFLHQHGNVPYPSYPALCHDDTTFHGGTDYGEHHAASVTQLRFNTNVKIALLVNRVLSKQRNSKRTRSRGRPLWLTCRRVAGELRPWGLRWPDGRPGGSAERSDNAPKTLRTLWSGGHEDQKWWKT